MLSMVASFSAPAEIDAASVPLFPNAVELAERGAIPGGTKRNRDALSPDVKFGDEVPEAIRVLQAGRDLADVLPAHGLRDGGRPRLRGHARRERRAFFAGLGRRSALM